MLTLRISWSNKVTARRMGTMMYFFSLVSKQASERATSTMSPAQNLDGSTFRKLNRGFLIICLKMQSDMCSHCMTFFCDVSSEIFNDIVVMVYILVLLHCQKYVVGVNKWFKRLGYFSFKNTGISN